ncbi:MAG: preprotein translocase subunit SecE [Lachnospiraceae bacterium]|nr:preprotein translocase subunit SecE [Lachnospiraceae bacterium]
MESEVQKASLFERIKEFFKGVRSEYSKIIFPNQEDLKKQTVAVIIASFFISLLILLIDTVFKFGLGFIL